MVPITGIDFRTGHKDFFFTIFIVSKVIKWKKKLKPCKSQHLCTSTSGYHWGSVILLCIDWSYMVRVGSRYVKMYVFKWGCGSLDKARHVYMLIIQNKIQSTALPPASDPIRYWVLTPINEAIQKFFVNRWHHFSYSANSLWRILSILAGWHSMVYCTQVSWSRDCRASQHQHTVRCNFSANSLTPTRSLFQPTQTRCFKVWN